VTRRREGGEVGRTRRARVVALENQRRDRARECVFWSIHFGGSRAFDHVRRGDHELRVVL
jgi:hypothetical protein